MGEHGESHENVVLVVDLVAGRDLEAEETDADNEGKSQNAATTGSGTDDEQALEDGEEVHIIEDLWTGDEYEVTADAICGRCEVMLRQADEEYCSMCIMDLGGTWTPYAQVDPEEYLA